MDEHIHGGEMLCEPSDDGDYIGHGADGEPDAARRTRRIYVRLTPGQATAVTGAAAGLGLTAAGFCAKAALGAAETGQVQGVEAVREELRVAMRMLFDATAAVNLLGGFLDQAATASSAARQPLTRLSDLADRCYRAIDTMNELCEKISRCLPARRHRGGR